MDPSIEKAYKDKIIALLSALFPTAKIYLFGSRARGTHKSLSDVDIALDDAPHKIPFSKLGEARAVMETIHIPYKVDIVDINAVSKEMRENILKEKEIWKN